MLDFPNAPTVGQIFTSGNASWKWDGTKWVSTSGGPFLPLTGGVLSGPGNLALGGVAIPNPATAPILAGVYQILCSAGTMLLLSNMYFDTINWRAPQTGGSSYLQINPQNLLFYTAPSVAAGAIPTPALRLQIDNTGGLLISGNLSFAATQGIQGDTTGSNAAAGIVGEYRSTVVLSASAVALSNGVWGAVATLSLTAGDWDVWGEAWYSGTSSPTVLGAAVQPSIAQVSAPLDNGAVQITSGPVLSIGTVQATGPARFSFSTTTNVYLLAAGSFSTGTLNSFGRIRARRVR